MNSVQSIQRTLHLVDRNNMRKSYRRDSSGESKVRPIHLDLLLVSLDLGIGTLTSFILALVYFLKRF